MEDTNKLILKTLLQLSNEIRSLSASTKRMNEKLTAIETKLSFYERVRHSPSPAINTSDETIISTEPMTRILPPHKKESVTRKLKMLISTSWNKNKNGIERTEEEQARAYEALLDLAKDTLEQVDDTMFLPGRNKTFSNLEHTYQEILVDHFEKAASGIGLHLKDCAKHWAARRLLTREMINSSRQSIKRKKNDNNDEKKEDNDADNHNITSDNSDIKENITDDSDNNDMNDCDNHDDIDHQVEFVDNSSSPAEQISSPDGMIIGSPHSAPSPSPAKRQRQLKEEDDTIIT
ncbi:uncharacterized protein BX664DRAFT_340426 [Halteromyces radiatus]|uniref:uncharacterized protein n=1 Tax=Halteromyces radiatus TaxID=101107 RepID=UPI00222040CC|nr:uncharacterized protein BX664DRAFT_340426 [Halteromyces radiatus]KAI8081451.1 hypothetical protein BX664DRAFT_340426 [Halteromyces radiatus]